jgi:hypothetical protein
MFDFPDLVCCLKNSLHIKKLTENDIAYVWEIAPLKELFYVTGQEASNLQELIQIFQLDWTTWYIMLDQKGHSYGLIRLVPEMDESWSIHGIGWTQPGNSPRNFVLSWYAFHHFLFNRGIEIIRTYCNSINTNAVRFLSKSGYRYQYSMPGGGIDGQTMYLTISPNDFYNYSGTQSSQFELCTSTFEKKTIKLIGSKASTNRLKNQLFSFNSLNEIEAQFIQKKYFNEDYGYFFKLIPPPAIYIVSHCKNKFSELLINEINGQKKIVVLTVKKATLYQYLDFINFLTTTFNFDKNDVIFIRESHVNVDLKNALTISYKFAGTHHNSKSNVWII